MVLMRIVTDQILAEKEAINYQILWNIVMELVQFLKILIVMDLKMEKKFMLMELIHWMKTVTWFSLILEIKQDQSIEDQLIDQREHILVRVLILIINN